MATVHTDKNGKGVALPNQAASGEKTYVWGFDAADGALASGDSWELMPAGTLVKEVLLVIDTVDAGGAAISIGDDSTSDPDDVLDAKACSAVDIFQADTAFKVTTNPLAMGITVANATTAAFRIFVTVVE